MHTHTHTRARTHHDDAVDFRVAQAVAEQVVRRCDVQVLDVDVTNSLWAGGRQRTYHSDATPMRICERTPQRDSFGNCSVCQLARASYKRLLLLRRRRLLLLRLLLLLLLLLLC
jgi:hypothetical protein